MSITLKQVTDQIFTFAAAHQMIKRYGFEFKEQMQNLATEEESWPYFFLVPVSATSLENVVEFEFEAWCVDRLQKDRTNTKFIVSDTQFILDNFASWLEEGEHDLEVDQIWPMTPVNNDLLDYVAGWSMRVKCITQRPQLCEAPII